MHVQQHVSPTLAFDYDYEFIDQERILQHVYRVSLNNGLVYSLTTPLQRFDFATGYVWDFWVICSLSELLQDIESTEGASTWAVRFLYNWTCYVGHLIFDLEIDDATKVRLLKSIFSWVLA